VTGRIKASGGRGAWGTTTYTQGGWSGYAGGGGGGSGGAIRLVATTVSGDGSLTVSGGAGLAGVSGGYYPSPSFNNAGMGRVRIDAFSNLYNGSVNGVLTTGFQPIIIPALGQGVQLSIASVAGASVSTTPTGQLVPPDAIISGHQVNPIPVVVNCSNLPLNTLITVTVTPANGLSVSAVGYNTGGTLASSTATILVNMPRGGGIIYATTETGN
jgi:hypothetical protein